MFWGKEIRKAERRLDERWGREMKCRWRKVFTFFLFLMMDKGLRRRTAEAVTDWTYAQYCITSLRYLAFSRFCLTPSTHLSRVNPFFSPPPFLFGFSFSAAYLHLMLSSILLCCLTLFPLTLWSLNPQPVIPPPLLFSPNQQKYPLSLFNFPFSVFTSPPVYWVLFGLFFSLSHLLPSLPISVDVNS